MCYALLHSMLEAVALHGSMHNMHDWNVHIPINLSETKSETKSLKKFLFKSMTLKI